jgi:hypothetical protein
MPHYVTCTNVIANRALDKLDPTFMSGNKEQKRSSTWGTIALVIGIISIFTPRLFLSIILLALAIFTILGLIKDSSKIPSIIALVIGGLIFFSELNYEKKSLDTYSVEYQVECYKCDVNYTNETGGSNKVEKVKGNWSVTLNFKGDNFIRVSGQNQDVDKEITARILVNGKLLKEGKSQGRYQIAEVYGTPKNIDGY